MRREKGNVTQGSDSEGGPYSRASSRFGFSALCACFLITLKGNRELNLEIRPLIAIAWQCEMQGRFDAEIAPAVRIRAGKVKLASSDNRQSWSDLESKI